VSNMSKLLAEHAASETRLPNDKELNTISNLAQQQKHLIELIEQREDEVKKLKAELKQVQETDLPSEMNAIGLAEIKLTSGETVEIKSGYAGAISKANQPRAYNWLEDNGYGALIKTDFTIKFGKGESDKASGLRNLLEVNGIKYGQKEGVHAQTLKAFIREVMDRQAEGEIEVPEEVFSIYRWNKAEIK